ncbi:MAG: hypothetical protein V5A66_00380 [Candidatus Thermoplasmatota archaeon]
MGDNDPVIRCQFDVVEDAQLEVNIEGVEEGHQVNLFNPSGMRVGTTNISSDDIPDRLIGVVQATVEVSMSDEENSNPIPGNYSFVVNDPSSDDPIYEKELTFDGPDIEIIDTELETEQDDESDERKIIGIKVEVENDGDLPVFADEMNLTVENETENIRFDEEQELIPGETIELDENITDSDLSIAMEDPQLVRLELYSFEDELASYEKK